MKALKIIYCLTHPIQYQAPLIRYLVQHGIDLEVIYASHKSVTGYFDREFNKTIAWDVDLLGGYPSHVCELPENAPTSKRTDYLQNRFKDLGADIVWVHGWSDSTAVSATRAAHRLNLPVMLRAETNPRCLRGNALRRWLHRAYLRKQFRKIAAFLAVGKYNRELYLDYGVPSHKIFSVPYAIDHAFFAQASQAADADRLATRAELGFDDGTCVFLFSGKLIEKKNPSLILSALKILAEDIRKKIGIIFVGEGELQAALAAQAKEIPSAKIYYAGFQNQTKLPELYNSCDAFILPSTFEPWGLVVNELIACGKPILLSDKIGASGDLLHEGENGYSFPSNDAESLAKLMQRITEDPTWREQAGRVSRSIADRWTFAECLSGLNSALAYLSSHTGRR